MIVHGVLSLDVGGLERIVVDLAQHQKNAAIICVERPGDLAAGLHKQGITIRTLHKPPGRDSAYIAVADQLLQALKPSVLHTHQIGAAWYLAPAAKRLGIRVVHTEHGNPFARAGSWWQRFKLRWLLRQAAKSIDAFAVVTSDIAEACSGCVAKTKIKIVPNGIRIPQPNKPRSEIRSSLNIPPNAFVIGTVGRLNEVKRQDILLRAFAALPNGFLVLVGDGPEKLALEQMACQLKINERVVFAGYRDNPIDFLHAMDVFILTSRSEGFPVSLLEAWSAKLPAVVSAVGGLKSIVEHDRTGVLVPDRPTTAFTLINLFTIEFERLRGDPALRGRLGEAGHAELLAKYTFERMADAYNRLYTE